MKADIRIEFADKDYDLVSCLLEALEKVSINYDCKEKNFRIVKGEPLWTNLSETQETQFRISTESHQ